MSFPKRIQTSLNRLSAGWPSSRLFNRLFPWTVLCLGLVITMLLWKNARRQLDHDLASEFRATVEEVVRDIELHMETNKLLLHGLQGLFSSSSRVSRHEFHTYIQTLHLKTRYPGIQSLGFALIVPKHKLKAHVAAMRAEGVPHYHIHANTEHPIVAATIYVEPVSETRQHALGVDMYANPVLRDAMEQARSKHKVILSRIFTKKTMADGKIVPEFAIFLPIYQHFGRPYDPGKRPTDQVVGWVYAQFRADEFADFLSTAHKRKIQWSIYDGKTIEAATHLASSHTTSSPHQRAVLHVTHPMHIAEHIWTLEATSLPQMEKRFDSVLPWLVLLGGTGISILLSWLMHLLAHGRTRALEVAQAMNQELIKSEYRWKFALEGAGESVWDWNITTGYMFQSRRLKEDILGYREDEYPDTFAFWKQLIHPEDILLVTQALNNYFENDAKDFIVETRMQCRDGTWKWILMRGMIVSRDSIGRPLRMIGTHADITERHKNDESLRMASTVLDTMIEAVFITDAQHNILSVNSSFTKITGFLPEDIVGKQMVALATDPDMAEKMETIQNTLTQTGSFAGEFTHRRKTGELYVAWLSINSVRNHLGDVTNRVVVFSDISERKANEERMQYLAHFDPLTDLPNRSLFTDRLRQGLAICRRSQERLAVLFVDLDKFKPVNDTLGHAVGDLLLKEVAFRLLDNIRESDSAARLGGDEFVVVLTAIETELDAVMVAEKILSAINKPYLLDGHTVNISCSIGIAIYPNHGYTDHELLSHADEAMYFSKHGGGSAVATYDQFLAATPPA